MSDLLYALLILLNIVLVIFVFRGRKFCICMLAIESGLFFGVLVFTSSFAVLSLIVNHGWALVIGVVIALLAYKMS